MRTVVELFSSFIPLCCFFRRNYHRTPSDSGLSFHLFNPSFHLFLPLFLLLVIQQRQVIKLHYHRKMAYKQHKNSNCSPVLVILFCSSLVDLQVLSDRRHFLSQEFFPITSLDHKSIFFLTHHTTCRSKSWILKQKPDDAAFRIYLQAMSIEKLVVNSSHCRRLCLAQLNILILNVIG